MVQEETQISPVFSGIPSSCSSAHPYLSLHNRLQDTERKESEYNENRQPLEQQEKEFTVRMGDGRDRGVLYFFLNMYSFSEFCTAHRVLCFFCSYLKLLITTAI